MSPGHVLRSLLSCSLVVALAGPVIAAPPCEPRRLNDWRLRCAADRDEIGDSLGWARGSRTHAGVKSVGRACRALAGSGGACAEARAELLALLLNVGAGRLNPECCLQAGDAVKTVSALLWNADDALADGCAAQQCERIIRGLQGVNDRTRLMACPLAGEPVAEAPRDAPDSAGTVAGSAPADDPPDAPAPLVIEPTPGTAGLLDAAPSGAPEPVIPPDTCCDPRTAEAWERACTLSGKWTTLTRLLDSDNQRDFGVTTCAGLGSIDLDEREQAKRQLIALRLNVRSGYLASACRLTTGETVEQAGRNAFALRVAGQSAAARDRASGINSGRLLAMPRPCAQPGGDDDLSWEPPPPPPPAATEPAPAPTRPPARRGRGR